MNPAPLIFKPRPVARPWGGARASQRFGWEAPKGEPTGEWWLVSSRPECPTEVLEGQFEGKTLSELVVTHGGELTGTPIDDPEEFPCLIKILDAKTRLSVQLHPSDQLAPNQGKNEAWWVLEAAPDAQLLVGLNDSATVDQFFDEARDGKDVGRHLKAHAASPGTLVEVPPGMIHALGADILALEVQQNSDTTYRIFDWNRLPKRRLHLEEAQKAVSDQQSARSHAVTETSEAEPSMQTLLDNEHFSMARLPLRGEQSFELEGFGILVPLEGAIRVGCQQGDYIVPRAHGALLPPGPIYRIAHDTQSSNVKAGDANQVVWVTPRICGKRP